MNNFNCNNTKFIINRKSSKSDSASSFNCCITNSTPNTTSILKRHRFSSNGSSIHNNFFNLTQHQPILQRSFDAFQVYNKFNSFTVPIELQTHETKPMICFPGISLFQKFPPLSEINKPHLNHLINLGFISNARHCKCGKFSHEFGTAKNDQILYFSRFNQETTSSLESKCYEKNQNQRLSSSVAPPKKQWIKNFISGKCHVNLLMRERKLNIRKNVITIIIIVLILREVNNISYLYETLFFILRNDMIINIVANFTKKSSFCRHFSIKSID